MKCPVFYAKAPLFVARLLLAKDGIRHVVKVGSRHGHTFSLAYEDRFSDAVKAYLVEWVFGLDPNFGYVAVYLCGGDRLWFILRDAEVPEGIVRESVHMADIAEDEDRPIGLPIRYRREFTFEELGI